MTQRSLGKQQACDLPHPSLGEARSESWVEEDRKVEGIPPCRLVPYVLGNVACLDRGEEDTHMGAVDD